MSIWSGGLLISNLQTFIEADDEDKEEAVDKKNSIFKANIPTPTSPEITMRD